MTPEDRDLLQGLRRQQQELRETLARLDEQMERLEDRAEKSSSPPPPPELPPIPTAARHEESAPVLPPIPVAAVLPPVPPPKPPVRASKPPVEFQFGRWLVRIGAVMGVIVLALVLSWSHSFIYRLLGPAGILALSAAASVIVGIFGGFLERKGPSFVFFGRSLTAMALAWLYLTIYTACYSKSFLVIQSPFIALVLLLLWSAYVFHLAERKRSQTLSLFAITLAYFSTAINPMGHLSMSANLLLAGTAVLFMVRNGWSALSYFSLIGTYYALFRRLIIDENGEFSLDPGRTIYFWPYAVYLTGAWIIFTAAVWFCSAPTFWGGKRLAFLSLNNGAWSGLLLLTAYIAGYGHGPLGWILLSTGLILLVASRFVGWTRVDPDKVMAAYAAQGLALFTAGILVVFTGITRGVMFTLETFFFGCAGTFAADRVLLSSTFVSAFFATLFLTWEIAANAHHPWLLGFTGAAVMLLNAWMSRSDIRHSPKARSTVVLSSSYYCTLAIGLIFTSLCTELGASTLPPALALTALVLTFAIYYFSLYELPPLAQILLLAAQAMVVFPVDTGEGLPWWTTFWVAVITLLMITWWSRQRITRTSGWTTGLTLVYSLALANLTYQTVRPWVNLEEWMVTAGILSAVFLAWGALTRAWSLAVVGQLFLLVALYHFFLPPGDKAFPWAWWAGAVLLMVVFATAKATDSWLVLFPGLHESRKSWLRIAAYAYRLLALGMVVWWVAAAVPTLNQVATFIFLGMLVFIHNIRTPSRFGIRCSYVLTLAGLWVYLANLTENAQALSTSINALAFLCLLVQPAFLMRGPKTLVTIYERWALILLSVGAGLFFISALVLTKFNPGYLTMDWALYGLLLFMFGLNIREPRLRWCGLAVLLAAIVRVFVHDFWEFSTGFRVLTFVALTLISLFTGYVNLRYAERIKRES